MKNRTVNAKTLAEVLGITEQYVNKLAKIGILEKHGRGKFPLESKYHQVCGISEIKRRS